jgi:ferredoxin-nitrate reductase
MFKSGAVRVTKVEKQDDGEVHIHEQQTSAVKRVEQIRKRHTATSPRETPELERYLEFWLAITFDAFKSLRSICDDLIPKMSHGDWEVCSGMQVMHRIVTLCVEHFEPHVLKYRAVGNFGHDINAKLKDNLFPADVVGHFSGSESFDTMVALQGFYTFLSQIEAHLITLSPSAQATWDKAFISAVAFLQTQLGRMQAWTKQQLKSRAPQALLVPCQPAADLKKRFEKGNGVKRNHKNKEPHESH